MSCREITASLCMRLGSSNPPTTISATARAPSCGLKRYPADEANCSASESRFSGGASAFQISGETFNCEGFKAPSASCRASF